MSNVTPLNANATAYGEPNDETVQLLEELLALARAGTLTHIAYAGCKVGHVSVRGWSGLGAGDFTLAAAIGMLFHDYYSELNKEV